MQNLRDRLKKKGWNKKDISKTIKIIQKSKKDVSKEINFLQKRIYSLLFVLIIVANFTISVSLVPLLIGLKGNSLYFILVIIGIIFGLVFEILIRSIEHLEKKHHIFLALVIPVTALINSYVISDISNKLINDLGLNNAHNPWIISIIYSTAFVLPYIIYRFVLRIEYYSK
jgi:hypothetical protein